MAMKLTGQDFKWYNMVNNSLFYMFKRLQFIYMYGTDTFIYVSPNPIHSNLLNSMQVEELALKVRKHMASMTYINMDALSKELAKIFDGATVLITIGSNGILSYKDLQYICYFTTEWKTVGPMMKNGEFVFEVTN